MKLSKGERIRYTLPIPIRCRRQTDEVAQCDAKECKTRHLYVEVMLPYEYDWEYLEGKIQNS
jgi:hypothetical protein